MTKCGCLFLLPNLLADDANMDLYLPKGLGTIVEKLAGLIVESEKGGRRFLAHFLPQGKFKNIPLKVLNEHSKEKELSVLLEPILKGEDWGVVSDAGLPCLADPGANLVFLARQKGIDIQTFSGPSSPILALLLSGLPAQSFAFHGYLPRSEEELKAKILLLEKRARAENAPQLFMETPYRFAKMLKMLLKTLKNETLLSIATNLTSPLQEVKTQGVVEWKKEVVLDEDKLAIFIIY